MFSQLLDLKVQQFIKDNTGSPTDRLALQKNPFPELQWADILNQVSARAKAKVKLPTWFETEGIIYPSKISVEQTSSETAAEYKAGLVSGESLIDLTGGFGIDDYYFSKRMGNVTHCELNLELSAIAKHNFEMLGAENIECLPGDSLDILELLDKQWDWMYIDPSRRSDAKGKVFLLKDCLPNVPMLLDTYFKYTKRILVKTAPLLDISAGLGELHSVKAIHIVAVNNEVKELLWMLEKGHEGAPMLYAAALTKDSLEIFESAYDDPDEAFYELPQKYLYEPNSAIMKLGAFDAVSRHYSVAKLHKHTQLYTSNELIDLPGRRFVINETIPFQKDLMKQFQGEKMNITVRNFPISVEELRKKWKLKDGGDVYAFFTTDKKEEKVVLMCSKV
ncbi:THUMP-like domain-containing protein [Flavobacterium sp.]|uniref:THUMP-like domain-containing protein n=1 Tax=Flavobacterium sp. TaxID=239 RepID=UPI0040338DCA